MVNLSLQSIFGISNGLLQFCLVVSIGLCQYILGIIQCGGKGINAITQSGVLVVQVCHGIVKIGLYLVNLSLQSIFVALVVCELCIDGFICGNGSVEIERGLICSICKPSHEDIAVNCGVFKGNRVAICNRDLFIINSVNTVVYGNGADRLDSDVLACCVGLIRRRTHLQGTGLIVACVNG